MFRVRWVEGAGSAEVAKGGQRIAILLYSLVICAYVHILFIYICVYIYMYIYM